MNSTLAFLLAFALSAPQFLAGQHIVPLSEFNQRFSAAAADREVKLAQFDRLLRNQAVRNTLQTARLDPAELRRAATLLTDDELAGLSARAIQIENDVTAGALTNQQLTYIVIALATAVIVLILV